MRILYLCKRHYMSHDVIVDRYARLYEQPYQLAQLGNDVLSVCLSYRYCQEKNETHSTTLGTMKWIGLSSGRLKFNALFYPTKVLKLAMEFKPDVIIGASDCLHIILAQWISQKLKINFAADLYDDYETFGLSKIPFIKTLYRRALAKAKIISCVSRSLADHARKYYSDQATIIAMPSTINQDIFYSRDSDDMRRKFSLPLNVFLVGTAGGLSKEKGIGAVYISFMELVTARPDIHCVVAGPTDPNYPLPKHERIHYLGILSHESVAEFFCCLNVGIVYLRNTQYGQLSFPQKAYEMAACKIPMVVAEVGDMKFLFSRAHNELYHPDNPQDLTKSTLGQLSNPQAPKFDIETWRDQSIKLLEALKS